MAERREDLRAADADRQFVADRLRDALNEGRLSLGEYDDRLKQAYAAKTYGDLDRLLGDLPTVVGPQQSQVVPAGPRPAPPQQRPSQQQPAPARGRMAGWLVGVWSAWLAAVFINVVIWLLVCVSAGKLIYFWPMWVAGPWGAVLLAMSVSGLARGDHQRQDSYERYAERRTRRQARRDRRMRRYQDRWS
ncbi:MAG TPA: DUF1707 domain-containing protein [Rugosimonospora sp.]|nr:DUF1707 domain-containing protein [Rugosimonospora sp.]